jgi:hypothetical protein
VRTGPHYLRTARKHPLRPRLMRIATFSFGAALDWSSVYSSGLNKLNFVFRNEYFEPLKGGFGAKNTASREFGKTIVLSNRMFSGQMIYVLRLLQIEYQPDKAVRNIWLSVIGSRVISQTGRCGSNHPSCSRPSSLSR